VLHSALHKYQVLPNQGLSQYAESWLWAPDLQEWLAKHGADPMIMTQPEFARFVLSESENATRVIEARDQTSISVRRGLTRLRLPLIKLPFCIAASCIAVATRRNFAQGRPSESLAAAAI
jgi:hypothetical protein